MVTATLKHRLYYMIEAYDWQFCFCKSQRARHRMCTYTNANTGIGFASYLRHPRSVACFSCPILSASPSRILELIISNTNITFGSCGLCLADSFDIIFDLQDMATTSDQADPTKPNHNYGEPITELRPEAKELLREYAKVPEKDMVAHVNRMVIFKSWASI